MNEKRRPQGRDNGPRRDNAPRRADRFAERTVVEEVEGQLEGRNALTALRSVRLPLRKSKARSRAATP